MDRMPTRHQRENLARARSAVLILMTWLAAAATVAEATPSRAVHAPRASATHTPRRGHVEIVSMSGRPDLIMGGQALIQISLPPHTPLRTLSVRLGSTNITKAFARRDDGLIEGSVTGLANGKNLLSARLTNGPGAHLTLTNHSQGGPLFSGPQIEPFLCETASNGLGNPTDSQCDAPAQISYLYQPAGKSAGDYETYDPTNPPTDVATTTTDTGLKVPYIIRVETGTLNRAIYETMVLADPKQPWTAVAPQPTWNRKLMIAFGGGCGTPHEQTAAYTDDPEFGNTAGNGDPEEPQLLAAGWMTTTASLLSFNNDCNTVLSAETVTMLKQHIIDTNGPILRTIGVGGSGGSIQNYNIASAYPGLLDGIVPTESFPDTWAMTEDTSDCYLLDHYFVEDSPELWLDPLQQLAVEGKSGPASCGEFVATLSDWFDPQARGPFQTNVAVRPSCQLPSAELYNPKTNPTGARCSVQDFENAIWGDGGPDHAAPLPYDNTGVQYGLDALQNKTITPAQFVDLNTKIGGIDNEGDFTTSRSAMNAQTAATMYRADQTTEGFALADVPILDVRQVTSQAAPETLSDMHQPFYTAVMQARLTAANGTAANMVTWTGIPANMDVPAVLDVDRWLTAVDADHRDGSLAQKIIRDRPSDVQDTCWINGNPVTDASACAKQYPGPANGGDARIAAGEGIADDIRKCQLVPLDPHRYAVTFTAAQWSQLEQDFPMGVCDWARPSVGYQKATGWVSFMNGPGGMPLGAAPTSTPTTPRPAHKPPKKSHPKSKHHPKSTHPSQRSHGR